LKDLTGWGHHPIVRGEERLSEDLEGASAEMPLTRGLGRSYGDASLPARAETSVLGSRLADRILHFDRETGTLRAESGLCLGDLARLLPGTGFATPVVPGTQYVTLGGMVASDIHGKNHHIAGCIGQHVRALRIRVADERVLEISPESEPQLFDATLGGMGLTGHLLEVELQLERTPSAWIHSESTRVPDLETLIDRLRASAGEWPFTVGWADCTTRGAGMGRGILTVGRWARADEAPPAPPAPKRRVGIPVTLPVGLVVPFSVRIFNALWYHALGGAGRRGVTHPEAFFHPLDSVRDWNRLYGPQGMVQYQCVLPVDRAPESPRRFFDVLTRMGGASPLSVIKDCGREGRGTLSFPMPGISIALDLPYRDGSTQGLVDALNDVVCEAGGRIYLSKDALTRREHFEAMETRLPDFQAIRRRWDPELRLRSALSVRLLGDPAP
jgi:FAD/FMN-containing dehydrogenase